MSKAASFGFNFFRQAEDKETKTTIAILISSVAGKNSTGNRRKHKTAYDIIEAKL